MDSLKSDKARASKARIIETSDRLFRSLGLHQVSTNIIARECGISPGHLYYYFNNKEEIILSLLDIMCRKECVLGERNASNRINTLEEYFGGLFAIYSEYHYLRAEFSFLINSDSRIRQWLTDYEKDKRYYIGETLEHLVNQGMIRKLAEQEKQQLVVILTLLTIYWIPFRSLVGTDTKEASIQSGIDAVVSILKPYQN